MTAIEYHNLTQFADDNLRLVYLRSTDIEQMNWHRLLWAVPDEWLFHLFGGRDIVLHDKSSNKTGKIERVFCPVFNHVMSQIAYGGSARKHPMIEHIRAAEVALKADRALRTKYEFWGRQLCVKRGVVAVRTIRVEKEENPLRKESEESK